MRRYLLIAALMFVSAQLTQSGDRTRVFLTEVQKLKVSPPTTDEELQQLGEVLAQAAWELIRLAPELPNEKGALDRISLKFSRGDGSTPARVEGQTVLVSIWPFYELMSAPLLLGHDIFVSEGHDFPVPSTIAYGPLASSALIPLADQLAGWLDAGAGHAMCPPNLADCTLPQAVAVLAGTAGFVLAHEAGHIILKHPAGVQATATELEADAYAHAHLSRLLAVLNERGDLPNSIRVAIRAAPPLMLMVQKSRRMSRSFVGEHDPLVRAYDERYEHLLALMTDDERSDVEALLEHEEMEGGFGRLLISSPSDVDAIAIDGLPLRPADVIGKQVRLPIGRHTVVAQSGARLAYSSISIVASDEKAALTFRSATCPANASAVEAFARRREWWEALLAAGGLACPDRGPDGLRRYEALYRLKLGFMIPAAPADLRSDAEIRRVDEWRRTSLPLGTWR
jgi:hypothetical protein